MDMKAKKLIISFYILHRSSPGQTMVTMLIFQINRIISSEKWFNYVVTFFFSKMPKNLGRSDDGKRKKKRMALQVKKVRKERNNN